MLGVFLIICTSGVDAGPLTEPSWLVQLAPGISLLCFPGAGTASGLPQTPALTWVLGEPYSDPHTCIKPSPNVKCEPI